MQSHPVYSIIIPFYNRAWCVQRAINSAIEAIRHTDIPTEILLINDGSTDDSMDVCKQVIQNNLQTPNLTIRIIQHHRNLGVCASKNTGARSAAGKWLIFLDSDDEMLASSISNITDRLSKNENIPLHFFASTLNHNDYDNVELESEVVSLKRYLNSGVGFEAMPVILREIFVKYLYDEDLNGYESLSYARIITEYLFYVKHSTVTRIYHTDHEDRLSSKKGMLQRHKSLLVGHKRFLRENIANLNGFGLTRQIARIIKCQIYILINALKF